MARNPLGFVIGLIMVATAVLMLLPAMVDLVDGADDWVAFLLSATAIGFVGGALVLSSRFRGRAELTRRHAFMLTVASWIVVPSVSALPLLGLQLSYTDAFFETMSGMTTTGATVLSGLDSLSRGILLWRALLQWIGGIGIIVMAIMMLPFLRVGGMQLFLTESSSKPEREITSTYGLVVNILIIYLVLSGVCALIYHMLGMSGFDAICHAMTTVATAGFSTHDASFGHFASPNLEWAAIGFMIAGACPFVVYVQSVRGRWGALFGHPEVRSLALVLVVVSAGMAAWLAASRDLAPHDAVRLALFNVTSVLTTTGYASDDFAAWGAPAVGVFFVLIFVGGCTGSTSGGIKMFRYHIVGRMMLRHVKTLTSPNRVLPLTYAGKRVDSEIIFSVVAFLTAYLAVFFLASVALALTGLDLVTALSGAAAAVSNLGPALGPTIGPAGNFASLPDAAKWVLAIAMMLGRLELLAVLVLFLPDYWR